MNKKININLKKLSLLSLVVIGSLTTCFISQALPDSQSIIQQTNGATNIPVYVNGIKLNLSADTGLPYLEGSRTMVPVRIISENLNCNVKWENSNKSFTITSSDGKTVIKGFANKSNVTVNGVEKMIDSSPDVVVKQVGSRLFVPLRFFAENLNCTVDYKNRAVYITTSGNTPVIPTPTPQPSVGKLTKKYSDFKTDKEAIKYIADTLPDWTLTDNELGTQAVAGDGDILVDDAYGAVAHLTIRQWNNGGDIDSFDMAENAKDMATVKEILNYYCPEDGDEIYATLDKAINIKRKFSGTAKNGLKVSFDTDSSGFKLVIKK